MLAGTREDGLAERDRLEIVAPGDVGGLAGLQGAEQAGHGAGEGVGEPGFGPSGAVPTALVAPGRVIERARDAGGPAGPADRAQREPFRPLEPPADADVGRRPFTRRAVPDVVPGRAAGAAGILQDVAIQAVLVREGRARVGPGAGEHARGISQPVAE